MYLYCLDCDVKVTIMWIKFEEKNDNVFKWTKYRILKFECKRKDRNLTKLIHVKSNVHLTC